MVLSRSTELFSSNVMNAIDALIVVLDMEGNVVFTNDACQKLTGFAPEDVWGKPVWDNFVTDEEIEGTKAVFSSLVTFEENNRHINYWKTKSGERKLVSWSNTCLHNDQGDLELIVATGVDITQQRADQTALEEREAKYQAIISSAPDCIISIDEKGIIDEVNPAVERVFGYEPMEMVGKNVKLLMPEPYHSQHDGYLSNFIKTGEKKIIGKGREVEAKRKDGTVFPIRLSVEEILSRDKVFFIGVIHDLTSMKQQEERLRRAHKIEALGQLTGGIAHDFNNLLTIILGNLEILEGRKLGSDVSEILNEVFDVVGQGSRLVSQLLTFGRRQSLHPSNVIVNNIIKQLTKLLSRTLREDIEINLELDQNIWCCHIDVDQLETALLNVILNARDAMAEGGAIVIKTNNVRHDENSIPEYIELKAGDYVKVTIIDTGIGMSDEVLLKAYDPFFTTKGVGMGTGLGLSMVLGFAEQSKGNIHIESVEGEGTSVSIYLPRLLAGEEDNEQEISTTGQFDGIGRKILHIEDDSKVRKVNTRRLKALGYEVFTAKDAPAGLKILSEHNDINKVLTDIVMPGGMNGIDLARIITKKYPLTKILLTTGYSSDVLSPGFEEFIVLKKPFSKEELAQKLNEVSQDKSSG